jgi:hypothetical protein
LRAFDAGSVAVSGATLVEEPRTGAGRALNLTLVPDAGGSRAVVTGRMSCGDRDTTWTATIQYGSTQTVPTVTVE